MWAGGPLLAAILGGASAATADDAASRLEEARAHLQAGRYEEAARAFALAAREKGSGCSECLFGEATARLRLGDAKAARKLAERGLPLLQSDPGQLAAAYNLLGFALAREAGNRKDRLSDAAEAFRSSLAADPDNPMARLNLGIILLRVSRDEEGLAELRVFLERWPQDPGADRARLYVQNPRRARERFAPDFSVRTLQGEDISLASLRGRTVVLDFWGTWCPPCVASLPELKDLLRKYATDRLVLLSVSVGDEDEAWREFVAKKGMTWPQYRDADRRLVEAFQVRAYPTYVVIDGEGAILDQLQGLDESHSLAYRLRSRLDAILDAKR